MPTNETDRPGALSAAGKWLTLVDANNYGESWEQASSLFKDGIRTASLFLAGISKQQWRSTLSATLVPLGRVRSRELRSEQYVNELPSAPEGEYFVLEYETSFERQRKVDERLILMKDADGEWRVAEYRVLLA